MRFHIHGCENRHCDMFNPVDVCSLWVAELVPGVVARPSFVCSGCGCELRRVTTTVSSSVVGPAELTV